MGNSDEPLNDFIGSLKSNNNKSHDSDGVDMVELLAIQAQELSGPAFSDNVAKLANCLVTKDYKKMLNAPLDETSHGAKAVSKIEDCKIPSNVSELKSCKVNDCVYKVLRTDIKKNSNNLHVVESAICKSITAQGLVLDKLAQMILNRLSSLTKDLNYFLIL